MIMSLVLTHAVDVTCLFISCCCCPGSVHEKVFAIRRVWKLVVTVYMVFFVTLTVFPGITSEVQYCKVGDWMPIILIATFNLSDCVSRVREPVADVESFKGGSS